MRKKHIIIFLLGLFIFQSCSYKKRKILFKTDKAIETSSKNPVVIINPQDYAAHHVCKEGDILYVRLLNEQGDRSSYDKLTTSRDDAKFVVHDSVITLPSVGNVSVVGLSKNEIIDKLSEEYAQYIIDPIVDVEFVSLTVNILGEVLHPGRYPITEKMDLVEAIGLAGGFTPYGIYDNVKIIRGENENQEIIVVNVSDIKILGNKKLLLHDNDIIYVEPRKIKQFDTAVRPYLFLTSILSSAAAVFIVITRTN